MSYKIVRSGVDTLELSFKGYLSVEQVAMLDQARLEARDNRQPRALEIAPGVTFLVGEGGLRGGYTFTCDSGPDGEVWWFKSAVKLDWNIRVKVKAANLALRGWDGVKEKLYATLAAMAVEVTEESIGRVDFALDCTVPADFRIDPHTMVAKARSTHSENGINLEELGEWKVYSTGRRTESVTVGKMPGRQLIIYDKSQEIIDNKKDYWWKFFDVPPGTQIYRIECRFGKKFLKEKCGLSTWADLEQNLAGLVVDMLGDIRMCDRAKMTGKNVSRWKSHPLWWAASEYMHEHFPEAWRGRPARVITGERERMATIFNGLLRGTLVSFAQIAGVEEGDFNRFLIDLAEDVGDWRTQHREEFEKKWEKSGEKYRFITGQVGGQTDGE